MLSVEEEPLAPVHFARDDPRLLGETLILGAHHCFVHGGRVITYDCNGQWFRFVAGGNPFQVDVFEIKGGERIMFTVAHTGDGLTVLFTVDKDHGPITKLVIQSAKEQVHRMKHSL